MLKSEVHLRTYPQTLATFVTVWFTKIFLHESFEGRTSVVNSGKLDNSRFNMCLVSIITKCLVSVIIKCLVSVITKCLSLSL